MKTLSLSACLCLSLSLCLFSSSVKITRTLPEQQQPQKIYRAAPLKMQGLGKTICVSFFAQLIERFIVYQIHLEKYENR